MQPYINIIGFIANHIDTASTNTTGYKNTCLQENAMSSFVSRCVFLPSPVHTLLHVYLVLLQSHVNTCIHPLFATISPYHPLQDPVIACTGPCHPLYRQSIPFCSNVKVSRSKNTAKNICTSLSRDVCFLLLHIV